MNEPLPEGKKTKQKAFLPVSQVHQRGGASWEGLQISTSAEAESDSRIMLRDTLKTQKKRFWFCERTRTQGKRRNRGSSMPNILGVAVSRQEKVLYSDGPLQTVNGPRA